MTWKIVGQPNLHSSRFSDVGDVFARLNMTRNAAWELCREPVGPQLADERMGTAYADPYFWIQALDVIRVIHGETPKLWGAPYSPKAVMEATRRAGSDAYVES